MKLLSTSVDGWQSLDDDKDASGALERLLANAVMAERLVVLAGLGTSRYVADKDGKSLAPTMQDLWEQAEQLSTNLSFQEVLKRVGWSSGAPNDIERLLSRCQMALELEPDPGLADFVAEAEALIVVACRFVNEDVGLAVHETFLRRVARRSSSLPRTQLFTTNYDLAFETAAARAGFAVIDGFSHSYPQRFDGMYFDHDFATRDRERSAVPVDWVPNVVQLHKLHGSVDWVVGAGGSVRRDDRTPRPLIIYPRSSKFEVSYNQPFLELMARFQAALRRPETGLLVIGSGFHDDHITHPIMAALNANVRMSAIIISPGLETNPNEHLKRMSELIRSGDRRIALLDSTFEEAVARLPDLVPESELERHEERTSPTTDA